MEGLGVAANVIAVVDLSAKVAALCFQYSKEVAGARGDIQRLRTQVEHLGTAVRGTQRLVEGIKGRSLLISQELVDSIHECIADLERLEKKLDPKPARTMMRRLGLRALKWPFDSKEVDQVLSSLERHEKTILLGLQIDQTSALVDIQEGVRQLALQATEDATIARRPHRMMPFPPNPDFVHRPPIERWLQDQFGGPDRRMALVGMGGFGKSQLAIEFAHHVHEDRPGTSVFWVHGKSRATFEESYRTLADILALPRRHEPDVDVLTLVYDWLQRDDISPWFMVVDNADDAGVFFFHNRQDKSQDPLASYLPKSTNGKILVTSRSLDAAEKLAGRSRTILQIPTMQEDQALELLTKRLDGETDKAAAIELVSALDYIPLAVNQAAAYINRRSPRVSVMSYLDKFRTSEKQKDSLLRSDKGDLGRHDGVSNSVVVTWQVTFEQIKRERPRAANLLSLMSQFQAHNIPEYMLHSYDSDIAATDEGDADSVAAGTESDEVSDCENFENDMDTLRGYSLVALSSAGFCEMHSLVQFCTRLWISEFGDPARWSWLFVKLAADHFPSGAYETWGTCQSLLPHIEPVLSRKRKGQGDILDWAELLTKICWYMLMLGEYSRAEMLGEEAVNARKNVLGLSHPSTLTSMANLASTYRNQGRWKEAEELNVRVMETRKTVLGEVHPDTLISMGNLASTYRNQGRWKEAEELNVRVMETRKTVLGEEHPDTLISMANLASTFWNQGRWKEAEELEIRVMETRKTVHGEEHPDTLTSMANLASTFWNQGRWKEAEELNVRVMETRKTVLGEEHPDTLTSMANLASTFWNQGRWKEAKELNVRVIETSSTVHGEEHPDTLTSMANLASTFWNQGRWKEAEELDVRVMEINKRVLGEEHPHTLMSMANLASTYRNQGRWEEAEKLEVEVMEKSKTKLGADHPSTLTSMNNLAFTWYGQGRQNDACVLMQDCVSLQQKKLGHTHPHTKSSVATLESWQASYPAVEDGSSS
ncbi:Kinesin light chain 5 [Colletotrichum musicola]|uniref:Kinesin light chain 5 n=1 Tax=Colletotrichum musicola TaxID=2175873 RepID=A0A8H6J4G5_9PEZI|nr:Kinesin light chain 5 [Colletotrichum musicola]